MQKLSHESTKAIPLKLLPLHTRGLSPLYLIDIHILFFLFLQRDIVQRKEGYEARGNALENFITREKGYW